MSHKTAWVNRNPASSLSSDRIRPSPPPSRPSSTAPKAKGKPKESQPPKSPQVAALDSLLTALRTGPHTDKDTLGGCFCQARTHALSPHTPLCLHCGLILCTINPPHCACPHCGIPLLTDPKRHALIDQLEHELADTLAREADARQRAAEQARTAAGAFPALNGAAPPAPASAAQQQQQQHRNAPAHKVLSLNSKTKKVTVASYHTSPTPSRPESRAAHHEAPDAVPARVPPPPRDVAYVRDGMPDPARPWAKVAGERLRYVPPPHVDQGDDAASGSKTAKRKKKGGGKDGAGTVPATV